MALTERFEPTITVLPDGQLQVQEARIIEDENGEVSRTYWREVLDPAQDIGATDARGKPRDSRVLDIVATVHTPEVKAARQAFIAQQIEQ